MLRQSRRILPVVEAEFQELLKRFPPKPKKK
jgi:hypothetical protein